MTALELYQPLPQIAGFLFAWGVAMVTGLLMTKVR